MLFAVGNQNTHVYAVVLAEKILHHLLGSFEQYVSTKTETQNQRISKLYIYDIVVTFFNLHHVHAYILQ